MAHVLMLVLFAALGLLVLLGAVWVVTLKNLFRAALSLGVVLLGIAGLFLALEAEFLAFAQVLVYVGAVLTLVLFAIMLTARISGPETATGRHPLPAAIAAGALFAILSTATNSLTWPATASADPVSLPALGQQMVMTLILPFEVVSLVFVAAMVGAIVVASRRGTS